ncbi:uncharacterized protein RHOBADRAFT_51007 [Rhodotorula graminis WP1]|uniref:Major facilitator superfamily (MFS) profile domain-containing protein n=1 Tax=Rhodotorula graminis (strain WP1) TaxID=578459 RepID=A0A194SD90_RHOGW|nr:uncharacterized protein RHOBADRAFT_51007 [Rhodotorula graminis WP1]KPV78552.1 hypothetical protein RHOBADRAFT_51007 [Rhodotorula graminis WP1]
MGPPATPTDDAPASRDPPSPPLASPPRTRSSTHSYPPRSAPVERPVPPLEPPDRGKAAYLFLLGAFSIETVVWGLPSSYGLFLEYYQREGVNGHAASSSLLPLVGTVSSGAIYLLGPPISFLLNPRPRWRLNIIRAGALICSLSLLLSSFATAPWQLLLTQGLLYSIGGAMAYYSTFYYLQEWYVERRGFANGVCFAGTAAGGLVLPFILQALLEKYGAATTLQALSVSTFVLLGAALPLVRPRLPLPPKSADMRHEKKEEDPPREDRAVVDEPSRPQQPEKVTAKRLFKNIKLWVFLAANIGQAFGYFVTLLYLPTYASAVGLSGAEGSALLASVNGACVLSRVAMGVLSDKHSPHRLGFGTMLASSVAVLILWGVASTSLPPLLVFSIVLGLAAGGWTSLYSSIINSVVRDDPALASHLFSTLSFTRGLGALLVAPISTALIAHPLHGASAHTAYGAAGGKYGGVVLFAGLAMGVAAGCEAVEALLH